MSYYSYHNRIKQRITAGELETVEYRTNYPRIGECAVLVFRTAPHFRPIRPERYQEYRDVLKGATA